MPRLDKYDPRVIIYIKRAKFWSEHFPLEAASILARQDAGIKDHEVRTLTKIIREAQGLS